MNFILIKDLSSCSWISIILNNSIWKYFKCPLFLRKGLRATTSPVTVSEADGEVCLKVNKDKGREAYELLKMLYAWKEQADKLSSEEINREEYDNWRYHYPEFDTTQRWAKVPSQELSDALVEAFKDHLKDK